MKSKIVESVENYVKETMSGSTAHDFKHVDRVRNWALYIAKNESYENQEMVETAALLHDVGLPFCENRKFHGQVGADIANKYLTEHNYFQKEQVSEIVNAIKYHSSNKDGIGELLKIIRDADMLDLFGSVGIMRAFTSKSSIPEYDIENIKGETWEATNKDFDKRFSSGLGIGKYIIDQINFQISCYNNLNTNTAIELAKPLVSYMRDYIIQFESEIEEARNLAR